MIYELIFPDRKDYAQAKSQLHLFQSYEKEYDDFQEIAEVIEITEEQAKTIIIKNLDYDETDIEDAEQFSLYDMVVGDDFTIVASTDY